MIQELYEDGATVTYSYDNTGNLATVTDSETGITTTYYYDLIDRLVKYEEKGTNLTHSVTYIYDEKNNLSSLTEVINGVKTVYTYAYDNDNRVTSVSVGNGTTTISTVTYTYDAFGRMSQQVTKHGDSTSGTTVLTESATFNPGNTENSTSSQIASYNGFTYTYDDNGNITSVTYGGNTTTYEYDSANQLIRENNQLLGITQTWTYDNAGNILTRKEYDYTTGSLTGLTPTDTVSYGYGNSNWGDLLTSYDGQAITYDQVGNPLTDGTWTYTWQHGRQLSSMTDGSTTWNYTYNSDGLRTKRTNGTKTYNYVYNGNQLARMSTDGYDFYFAYDAAGIPLSVTLNNYTYYYVTNLQGDVVGILNEDGIQVVTYYYDAWGNVTYTSSDPIGDHNPLTYRGYVYDTETGLYYLQSRYYDPEIGRFINADNYPITGQGLTGNNMFAYCGSNPVSRKDDGGEFWNIVIGAVIGGVVSGLVSIATQAIENNGFDNINWGRVGVAAASGAVSGAFAATGIPVGGQIAINAAIGTLSSVADTYADKGKNATLVDYASNAATGLVLGAVAGYLGGNGTGTKHLSKSAGRLFKKVGTAIGDVFENGIKSTGKTILKAGKYYYSQVAKQSIQCGKKAILPIIISNIPNAAYNTWGALN